MALFKPTSWRRGLAAMLACGTILSTGIAQAAGPDAAAPATETPIKHIVVLFQENISFDHYFGTYPNAANNAGETTFAGVNAQIFKARKDTPTVNGYTPALLLHNPNHLADGTEANPFRLLPSQAYTCSQNHSYGPEEAAADAGLMDQFPQNNMNRGEGCDPSGSTVMAYFDGNTVTAMWNYAQHFALSDNSFGTTYGPSTTGALNLVSGNTFGAVLHFAASNSNVYLPASGPGTDIGDLDAFSDDCGNDAGGTKTTTATLEMTSKNIGDLLNAKNLTWGWFQGGFAPTQAAVLNPDGSVQTPAVCGASHLNSEVTINGVTYTVPNPTINPGADIHTAVADYSSHHEPFMFYASTRNPHHLRPTSTAAIGTTDQANHQYDTSDFFAALAAKNLPAVSFIKAPAYEDSHPGNSNPLMEQAWITQVINAIQTSPDWAHTAVIIAYDDSDGWYDHVLGSIENQSTIGADALLGAGSCGTVPTGSANGRCGRGPRLPMLVLSPYAKSNYVDHTLIDQSSIIAFIEANWDLGYIDGTTAPTYGTGSTDRYAGSIEGMFDFTAAKPCPIVLDEVTGALKPRSKSCAR